MKRSGRVMLVSAAVLFIFSSLVVWHDKAPALDALSIDLLLRANPAIGSFIDQVQQERESQAFFSVGLPGEQAWPWDISRACYPDPLAAHWQFSAISKMYPNDLEVLRYRSLQDFIDLLLDHEAEAPGYLAALDFTTHTPVMEDPFTISFRLFIAVIVGVLGLFAVRQIQKQK